MSNAALTRSKKMTESFLMQPPKKEKPRKEKEKKKKF